MHGIILHFLNIASDLPPPQPLPHASAQPLPLILLTNSFLQVIGKKRCDIVYIFLSMSRMCILQYVYALVNFQKQICGRLKYILVKRTMRWAGQKCTLDHPVRIWVSGVMRGLDLNNLYM
jgi:hypothetical protein